MSTLIITLIGVVLTAVIILAGYFYTGSITSDASVTAQTTGYLNEAKMVNSAYEMYASENAGSAPAGITELVSSNYIKQPSTKWTLINSGGVIMEADNISDKICKEVNKRAGVTGIPSCSTANLPDIACCTTP